MNQKTVRVLLIEDDERCAGAIRRAFEFGAAPVELTTVGTLQKARTCLAQSPPDLVIADLSLPDGKGTELLPAGKEDPRFPIVIMAGRGGERAALEAVRAGASDYVIKSEATLADMPRIACRALREWGHVTERRRAEEHLHLLSSAVEQSTEGIAVVDLEGNLLFVNEAFAAMHGRASRELLGKHLSMFHTSEQMPSVEAANRQIQETGEFNGEIWHVRRDGTAFPTWMRNSLLRDETGSPVGMIGTVRDIMDQKRAEEELRESEERLRRAADNMPVMMDAFDTGGNIIVWNRECERVTGYRADEMVGNPKAMELLYPDKAYRESMTVRWAERGDDYRDWEWEMTCKDGSVRTVAWSNISQRVPIPGWTSWGIGVDVTERKRAEEELTRYRDHLEELIQQRTSELANANAQLLEEITQRNEVEQALRESERKFRSLVETTSDWVWAVDHNGVYTYASPKVKDLLGYEPEEVVGKTPFDLMLRPEAEQVARLFTDAVASRQPFAGLENTNVHKDGRHVVLETSGVPILDVDGNLLGYRGIDRDITERKRTEEALRRSEERFSKAFHASPIPITITTLDEGRFIDVNERFLRTIGCTREEVVGHTALELGVWSKPEDRARMMRMLKEAGGCVRDVEVPVETKSGEIRRGELSTEVVDLEDELCLLMMVHDVTERKQAEQALREEQRLLKQLLDLQERDRKLVSYEIHDGLAQQLTGAMMQFQAFGQLRDRDPDEAQRVFDGALKLLGDSVAEARRLISGLRPPILDELGIVAAIDYLIGEQQERGGPEIEFRHDVQFDRLPAPLEGAVFRIVQETLANACRHSRSKKVRVELVERDGRVRVEVRDWGIGFDLAKVDKNRFGLQGVRERARLLGGQVAIETAPAKGTRVTIELPLLDGAPQEP